MDTMDTETRNDITGWSLLRGGMSGEAFSTAMRHAALLDMCEAQEMVALEYSIGGQPLPEDPRFRIGDRYLVISIKARS